MKKISFIALISLLLVACNQTQESVPSQEEKAEALIKDNLKKYLYKPETYKPIDTKVDSAFTPYDDPVFYETFLDIVKIGTEILEMENKAKHARSFMSIYDNPYQSSYEREEFQEYKDEYDEAKANINKLKKKGQKLYDKVSNILKGERKFIGYKVIHNYRADNNAGNTLIGNRVFFIDADFNEVIYSMELEDYNQVQEAIMEIRELIEDGYEDSLDKTDGIETENMTSKSELSDASNEYSSLSKKGNDGLADYQVQTQSKYTEDLLDIDDLDEDFDDIIDEDIIDNDAELSSLDLLEKRNHANVVKRAQLAGVSTEGSTIDILERINHANVVKRAQRVGVSTEGSTIDILERINKKELEKYSY